MATHKHLYGSCACARNQYTITLPTDPQELLRTAHVFFDNSAANRRAQASPLTLWLRIPLSTYHSSTYAQFDDERHTDIKRVFHSPPTRAVDEGLSTRKQFCGFCGSHLTAWSESGARGGGKWVEVTVGTLEAGGWEWLEGVGVLGGHEEDGEEGEQQGVERVVVGGEDEGKMEGVSRMQGRGMPWFEEMVEGGRFGRLKRQKGGRSDGNGRIVEWEVTEYEGPEDESMAEAEAEEVGGSEVGNKRLKLDG